MPINPKKENFLFFCIGLITVFSYISVVYTQTINMPKWDDFPDILQFMDRWLQADGFAEKTKIFFYHTNEHILLVNHTITLAQYYLVGHLDFSWLIYTGNFFYLGSAFLMWLPFKEKEESSFVFAILMLTVITFYPHESLLWAMTSISNQAVILFSLLALWYATQTSPSMVRVIFLTTLAIFSQSNGFLLLPIISVLLFFQHKKKLLPWLVFSIAMIIFYTCIFNPATSSNISSWAWTDIPVSHYGMVLPTLVAAFGSTLFNEASSQAFLLSLLLGCVILFFSLKQVIGGKHSRFTLCALLFFALCIASIACYRGLIGGPSIIFVSRYKMYGAYFIAIAILLSPQWLARCKISRCARYSTLLVAMLFCSASYYLNLPIAEKINGDLRKSLEYWIEDGDFRRGQGYFIKDSDSFLFAALHNGAWSPMALIKPEHIINDVNLLNSCPSASNPATRQQIDKIRIQHINRNAPGIRLEIISANLPTGGKRSIYLCSASANYRLDFKALQNKSSVYYIPATRITPEKYAIYTAFDNKLLATGETLWRKPNTR